MIKKAKQAGVIAVLFFIFSLSIYASERKKIFFLDFFPSFQVNSFSYQKLNPTREEYLLFLDAPRFFGAGIDLNVKGFNFYLRFEVFENFETYLRNDLYLNIFIDKKGFSSRNIYTMFPTCSYVEYTNSVLTLSLGRRRANISYGDYNFILSDYNPSLDGVVIFIDPLKDDESAPIKVFGSVIMAMGGIRANEDFLSYTNSLGEHVNNPENRYSGASKNYFVHQLGIYNDYFRISVADALIVYGTPFSIQTVSPFVLWHNSYLRNANSIISFASEARLPNDYRIYAEFCLDDVYFGGVDDSEKPTALGVLIGFDKKILDGEPYDGYQITDRDRAIKEKTFKPKTGLILGFECVFASKYLYLRPKSDPFGNMSFYNSYQTDSQGAIEPWSIVETYMGFPYGGGVLLVESRLEYINKKYKAHAKIGYLLEGERPSGFLGFTNGDFAQNNYIPKNEASKWAEFTNPMQSIKIDFSFYYNFRKYMFVYAGGKNKICINKFKKSVCSINLGYGIYLY